jgi:hypothetical protein
MTRITLDELLTLPEADFRNALAAIPDADLIKLADARSMTGVRSRYQAVKVAINERDLYAIFPLFGTH